MAFPQISLLRGTDRSLLRYRRALAGSAALAVCRAASLLSLLIVVPVLLQYLDTARFGLWMTFSAIIAPLAFADLGLGFGLMNATARESVRSGDPGVQRVVSSALAALTALTVPLAIGLTVAICVLPLDKWLGATAIPEWEVRISTLILVLGLLVSSIPGIAARVQTGLQTGYIASLCAGAGTLAGLAATVWGAAAGVPFVWLVGLFVGAPLLVTIANAVWYFRYHSPSLRPTLASVSKLDVEALFRSGSMFFVLQLCAALTFATDSLFVAAVLGVDAVPGYAVPARLFSCIGLAVAIAVQPLWPAYTEALERNDLQWIRGAFRRSMLLALTVSILAAGGFYVFRDLIFSLWTHGAVGIDSRVVAALAVWSVVDACCVTFAMLFNGLHIMRFQVITSVVMTACSFPARYWFLKEFGVWGLPLATTVVCVTTAVIPCLIVLPKALRTGRAN